PVNQTDFDVALQMVFDTREAHDAYQQAPRHLQFIEENKAGWERVRVFDSYVSRSSHNPHNRPSCLSPPPAYSAPPGAAARSHATDGARDAGQLIPPLAPAATAPMTLNARMPARNSQLRAISGGTPTLLIAAARH